MVLETTDNQNTQTDNLSFEDLLDSYMYESPTRGQILEGIILEAKHDQIILDVGLKRDAVVTRKDLERLSEEVIQKLQPGKEVLTYVLQPFSGDGELIVSINKALELEDWSIANKLMEADEITDALVIDSNKGGLLVRFGRLTGFVPNSHIESVPPATSTGRMREIKDGLIGKKLGLKVIQVETKRNRLILSERAARRAARSERLAEIEVGQQLLGRVVNLTDFGAFVDIGGVDGMIHISNIDHRHVNHPSDVLAVGDEVEVLVDSIDVERERIALNRKAILPDPWKSFTNAYEVNQLMEGVVTNVVDFGVFVAAPGGAQGLVHTSRMETLGASTPRDMFREGDAVLVRIVGIDTEQQHIELSIDDVTVDEQQAWMFRKREEAQTEESAEVVEGSEEASDDATEE
ncbi:MAG: S1 RNA-binding domain-containing protein [Phototrophicaceae bacterium]